MDLVLDASLQSPHKWGKTYGTRLSPVIAQQVASLLHTAQGGNQPMALTEGEAGLMADPLWLDLSGLKTVRKHPVDDFIITVETGITMGELLAVTRQQGQMFPLTYDEDTLLIEVLADDRPALETGFRGYLRDYVLKTEVATPDGVLAVAGADVVKNVTGYDLNKLYVGARHTLGVITAVTLKLFPLPLNARSWLLQADALDRAEDVVRKLLNSTLPLSVCELMHESERKTWQILIQVQGDELFLDEAQTVLDALLSAAIKPLKSTAEKKLYQGLRQWPEKSVVMEAALPLHRWPEFLHQLPELPSDTRLQIRPAAGLVYLVLNPLQENFETQLAALNRQTLQLDGFMQCVHAVPTLWPTLAAYNLPADPVNQALMQQLKRGFDPRNILFTPRLPLFSKEAAHA